MEPAVAADAAVARALHRIERLAAAGVDLSRDDCRVIVLSQFIASLGPVASPEWAVDALAKHEQFLGEACRLAPRPAKSRAMATLFSMDEPEH